MNKEIPKFSQKQVAFVKYRIRKLKMVLYFITGVLLISLIFFGVETINSAHQYGACMELLEFQLDYTSYVSDAQNFSINKTIYNFLRFKVEEMIKEDYTKANEEVMKR